MSTTTNVEQALDRFIERALSVQMEQSGRLPHQPYDPEWPSDCYQAPATPGQQTAWRPVRQCTASDLFERIGAALDQDIHPDIVSFYNRYWSDPLPARRSEGMLSLLQLWNPEDGERLRANLIGHALNQRRRKRPLSLFFACVEEDEDLFISLDNCNGSIWLESVRRGPLRQLDSSLAAFIDSLEPVATPDQE
ncbi:protein Syd [Marinobacterium nitratireducens]|uniref:Protein Syd n=1 Tax=Marinobacterium nitratireducens TaxID=518897 RepID=A0A917ZFI7_9GAMM|nr:SecY-interacting protein Syd [Marinobacterium nitratireducens]GGO81069.1 protein Syd [Marinobacterium nitratireducens]